MVITMDKRTTDVKSNPAPTTVAAPAPQVQEKPQPMKLEKDQHIAWANAGKRQAKVVYIADYTVPIEAVQHRLNLVEKTGGTYPCFFYEIRITDSELKSVSNGGQLADKPAPASTEAAPQTKEQLEASIKALQDKLAGLPNGGAQEQKAA